MYISICQLLLNVIWVDNSIGLVFLLFSLTILSIQHYFSIWYDYLYKQDCMCIVGMFSEAYLCIYIADTVYFFILAHSSIYLGVQQCFGVVYHELTTLRWVYFARAALAARAK